ncbi:autotransporter outer membrane beta-barrel domain-containing protein [uncultured Stenotrophomonas sp.]|uniref:autotransporter outer membrane beta-barrel domain-containing protein n=1 Tax=uncultured Stenotrophomonas sp. TaxID=165438 RepID=UPI0025FEAD56|nr:autotransporter outer membrane beta-barrel domain-containing protein [uncultured Stenotrophomonas sp.]
MNILSPCRLALAMVSVLAVSASAQARNLGPGQSATVDAGDAPEQWTLDKARLTLTPGAEALAVVAGNGSNVTVTEGTLTLASGTGAALSLTDSVGSLRGTTVDSSDAGIVLNDSTSNIYDSTINAGAIGLQLLQKSTATLNNTSIESAGSGLHLVGNGSVARLQSGSRVEAGGIAAMISGLGAGDPKQLVVDGSHLGSRTEAAIMVTGGAHAQIELRNGSTVSSGSDVLLETRSGVQADLLIDDSAISGDIRNDTGATTNVRLQNNAILTSAIRDASSVSLEKAQWNITGDSSVDALQLGAGGVVAFDTPSGGVHTTLTVGNFSGNDGTIVFNTVLGGDGSASDRLVVTGDTSGTANVRVNNIGGAGAQTVNGIELISVGGASNGVFALAGRAVGGSYEYFLHKGGAGAGSEGNWYLRSELPMAPPACDPAAPVPGCTPIVIPGDPDPGNPGDPDPGNPGYPDPGNPGDPDPENPGNPDPILRPEGGAYLANLQSAQQMFRSGYRDRQPGQNAGRAWVKVDGSRSGFDASSRQLDVSGSSQSLSVGANLWQHGSGSAAGVMLSSGNASSTSTNELTGYYARGKVRGEALGVYGTWRGGNATDANAGFYVDGSVQRAQFRNRVEGVGLETERYTSRAWQGAVEAGYAFRVGGASNGGFYLEPQLQLGYSQVSVGEHTEANGTVVQALAARGVFGRAGARLSGAMQWGDSGIRVQPYVAVSWLYSGADASVRMNDEIVDARIPRNRAELSGGASVDFGNGFGAWGGVSLQKASGYHQSSVQVGLSYRW